MRRYETIFILRPNAGEEEIQRVIDSTTGVITSENGTVIQLDKWGMKKLAYLIKKESLGFYIYLDYAGTPAAVSEIERKFRIDDTVMKYMTVKTADEITAEEVKAAIAAFEAAAATAAAEAEEETEEAAAADATSNDN
jgi:small subunit ribosomal protein S6